jgi:hypothetical protein
VNIERKERWWFVTISHMERIEMITEDDEHPPNRATAAVAHREGFDVPHLHCSEMRARSGRIEVMVRRR